MLAGIIPAGLVRFIAWNRKFRGLGYSRWEAARAAADNDRKRGYMQSRIEHLPEQVRTNLAYVVDVGANEGQWSTAVLSVVAPRRMELFEPNPEAAKILRSRLGARPGLSVHSLALGAESGELTMNILSSSNFSSFLDPRPEIGRYYGSKAIAVADRIAVPVRRLDDVLRDPETIDVLKIDVQGFECRVLLGAREVLRRTRTLIVEANLVSHYKEDDSFGSLAATVDGLGFGLWDISAPFRAEDGRALWCDAVFVNRELLRCARAPSLGYLLA